MWLVKPQGSLDPCYGGNCITIDQYCSLFISAARVIFRIMLHGGYFEYWKAGLVVVHGIVPKKSKIKGKLGNLFYSWVNDGASRERGLEGARPSPIIEGARPSPIMEDFPYGKVKEMLLGVREQIKRTLQERIVFLMINIILFSTPCYALMGCEPRVIFFVVEGVDEIIGMASAFAFHDSQDVSSYTFNPTILNWKRGKERGWVVERLLNQTFGDADADEDGKICKE
nr:hypothetical protein [Tanacetum cinerariifolium]